MDVVMTVRREPWLPWAQRWASSSASSAASRCCCWSGPRGHPWRRWRPR